MFSFTSAFNPAGWSFVDKGLGAIVGEAAEQGKFKVPGLRNIAKTSPYMHNGYFKTLRGVLEFYNNRDVWRDCKNPFVTETLALNNRCWPDPEVKKNVNFDELGELGLRETEIDDIVAFLNTLTEVIPSRIKQALPQPVSGNAIKNPPALIYRLC